MAPNITTKLVGSKRSLKIDGDADSVRESEQGANSRARKLREGFLEVVACLICLTD